MLYRLVQQRSASFIDHRVASAGNELSRRIKVEVDAFLECAFLAHFCLGPLVVP